ADALRTVDTVIIDEIHALVPTKRGAHMAITLERLEEVAGRRLQRIGLSATQRPLEEVARFLGGLEIVSKTPLLVKRKAELPEGKTLSSEMGEVHRHLAVDARSIDAEEESVALASSLDPLGSNGPDEQGEISLCYRRVTIVNASATKQLSL